MKSQQLKVLYQQISFYFTEKSSRIPGEKMENLDQIKVEKQTHPELSILSPFDLSVEYSQFPAEKFLGDSHYALQFCIVLHGSAEVLFEKFSREFNEGELWWNMCWEPHAYRLSGRRNFILAVNIDVEQLGSCSPFSGCNWLTPFIAHPENRYCPANDKERNFIVNAGKELYHLYQHQNNNWRISSWLLIHQILLYAINRMNWSELEDTMGRDSANSFPRIR